MSVDPDEWYLDLAELDGPWGLQEFDDVPYDVLPPQQGAAETTPI